MAEHAPTKETHHRLLVIDEEFPWPLNSGKRLRTYNLLQELARHNQVAFLAYGTEESESFRHFKSAGFNPIAVSPPDLRQHGPLFYLRLLANVASPYPFIVTRHYTRRFQKRLDETLHANRYDAVLVEWSPYARFVRDIGGVKKIIVAHNIESNIWRRYEQQEKNLLRKLYISLQRAKVEHFEARCFHWADGATAVSEAEAKTIAGFELPYEVAVIENGVDTEFFSGHEDATPGSIVFSGAMDWRPNQDAAEFLVHEILPLVKETHPEVTVTLVGRTPPDHIKALGSIDGVTVTGTVDDVRPYVRRAEVFAVPLRIGGGSRLKILEAMSLGKAVVSTAVGAEGLRVTDGENILLADEPQTFADAIASCLDDAALRERLGRAGRTLVEQKYRWSILGQKYHEYLCSIVSAEK